MDSRFAGELTRTPRYKDDSIMTPIQLDDSTMTTVMHTSYTNAIIITARTTYY